MPGAIGIHHIDLPVTVPVGDEGDFRPIRRPHRTRISCRIIGKVSLRRAVCVVHVYLPVAVPIIGYGGEGDSRPIRGPRWAPNLIKYRGERRQSGAVRIHYIHKPTAIPYPSCEGDLGSIRGPRWMVDQFVGKRGQGSQFGAIRLHDMYLRAIFLTGNEGYSRLHHVLWH